MIIFKIDNDTLNIEYQINKIKIIQLIGRWKMIQAVMSSLS